MANTECHIGIIGAGLGGLAAAIGIARSGHKVTIIEQAPVLGEVGAGIQIPPNSSRILKEWGILKEIEDLSVRPQNCILRRYRDGKKLSNLNLVPLVEEQYQHPYLHIHRADYHRVLVEEAERLGVKIQLDSIVEKIDFNKPKVYIKNKPDFEADLLIGADGLKSVCREALLGRADPPYLTGDLAYRITVSAEDMRKDPILKELAEQPNINIWMGPDAHAVCYLLKGGGLYNIVLICPDNLPELVSQAKADLKEMHDFFEHWDPQLRQLLRLCKETSKWRVQNSREMSSWSHPSGKFVLMGDACHATQPYLAQGAAMAVEDGAVLGALLERIKGKHQIPDLLVVYETIRKPRTTKVVQGSNHFGRTVFHLKDGARQQERDRQLLEHNDKPFEGYPNRWADPVFQEFLFGYNAFTEAEKAWQKYEEGTFPGTAGKYLAKL
ncbi:hypothetical protein LTR05_003290 [Lithohypha guttulata]|uniref:FAD-binding domain-containing protein n=1 Tax=Lithohypha guttulata TaxID=1690604 RepID=A0AAN7T3K5_9EURO|nr:hypothetical protein LTR05_003290 [Lithohypha guttulata]